jgi:hypothetical protein
MATVTIIQSAAPYYTVLVEFAGQQFNQTLVSAKTGAALTKQIQDYADEYEAAWLALPPPEPQE